MAASLLALMRIYQVTGDPNTFLRQNAIDYENSVFVKEACNWPDFRNHQGKKQPDGIEAKGK